MANIPNPVERFISRFIESDDGKESITSSAGTYSIEYGTPQCDWDEKDEWTAKVVTIPSGVPDYSITA